MSFSLSIAKSVILRSLGWCNVPATNTPSILKITRLMSSGGGRQNCILPFKPKCDKETLAKSDCMAEKKQKDEKPKKAFKSMWENPECCLDPCAEALPRFDALYWSISDKEKRHYMQTWVECPRIKIIPKKVCCFEQGQLPPLERRKRDQCPKTACNPTEECKPNSHSKCKKILMPCCGKARDPPKCRRERGPSHCRKVCTPYPSFSECKRDRPKPKHPVECGCLSIASMCDVWALLRRQHSSGKSSN